MLPRIKVSSEEMSGYWALEALDSTPFATCQFSKQPLVFLERVVWGIIKATLEGSCFMPVMIVCAEDLGEKAPHPRDDLDPQLFYRDGYGELIDSRCFPHDGWTREAVEGKGIARLEFLEDLIGVEHSRDALGLTNAISDAMKSLAQLVEILQSKGFHTVRVASPGVWPWLNHLSFLMNPIHQCGDIVSRHSYPMYGCSSTDEYEYLTARDKMAPLVNINGDLCDYETVSGLVSEYLGDFLSVSISTRAYEFNRSMDENVCFVSEGFSILGEPTFVINRYHIDMGDYVRTESFFRAALYELTLIRRRGSRF